MPPDDAIAPPRPQTAADLCRRMRLDPAAEALLDGVITPRGFVERLLDKNLSAAAIDVVAQALPRRYGLWWGLLCWQHATAAGSLMPGERALCRAVLAWIRAPGEPARVAAERAAWEAGTGSIAGLLASATATLEVDRAAATLARAVRHASAEAAPPLIPAVQRAYAILGLGVTLPAAASARASR